MQNYVCTFVDIKHEQSELMSVGRVPPRLQYLHVPGQKFPLTPAIDFILKHRSQGSHFIKLQGPSVSSTPLPPPRGRGVLPSKRPLGMCRWMGSHFHNWVDYNGVGYIFSRITRMGSHIFEISGIRKFW